MSDEDPYAPPTSDPEPATVPAARRRARPAYAARWQRFVNYIVDSMVTSGLGALFGAVIGTILVAVKGPDVDLETTAYDLLFMLFGFVITFAYYSLCEGFSGRTIGKLVTRTRVEHAQGGPISFRQALGRSLCRLIPFEAFSFLGDRPGWHDRFPRTVVVRIDGPPQRRSSRKVAHSRPADAAE